MDYSSVKRVLAGLIAAGGLLTAGTAYASAGGEPVAEPVSNETSISPLDILRSRSPVERWQQLRERWKQSAMPVQEATIVLDEPIPEMPPMDVLVPETHLADEPIPEMPVVDLPVPESRPSAEPMIHTISVQEDPELAEPTPDFPGLPFPGETTPRSGLPELRQGPFAPDAPTEGRALTPRDLKRMTQILPFYDYEPDPEIRENDPCANLCPRPEGCPPSEGEPPLCPEELPLTDELYAGRLLPESLFAYTATNLFHNPLYFEDPQLERYGHTYHHLIQPFDSVGLFGLQLLGLPAQMTIDPICKKMYPLGYYRPGECAPKLHYQIPWNTRAAINQAAVTTGAIFIFP